MATEGLVADDSGLVNEVLVMTTIMCFMADSPITSTPNPGTSLNPCQIFSLSLATSNEKKEMNGLQKFLGMNYHGLKLLNFCPFNSFFLDY
jgi:hypothetical protein